MGQCDLVFIDGLKKSQRRGIALLRHDDDSEVDAVDVFKRLPEKSDFTLRSRFDQWIENVDHNNRWFHGFNEPQYRMCFVFKWKEGNKGRRLYGFLCNPVAENESSIPTLRVDESCR